MWLLPKLVSADRTWNLPLCEHTAAKLTLALLCQCRHEQASRIAELLPHDAPLTLWILCRAPHWVETSPGTWEDLASWFQIEALRDLCSLEAANPAEDPCQGNQKIWAELAATSAATDRNDCHSPPVSESEIHGQLYLLLCNATEWLGSCGPKVDGQRLASQTAWFPRWLQAAENSRPNGIDRSHESSPVREHWLTPGQSDVALSAILPRVSSTVQKLNEFQVHFNVALERAKLESLRQLAYGASHEINNPLANIATRAQTLLREEPDPERRRKLATIVSQAFRAHEMISDLMLFAKPPPMVLTSWEVADLVREIEAELSSDSREQGTELHWTCEENLAITADRTQIGVAVQAIVRNALEALGQGGIVQVSVRSTESAGERQVLIEVRDSGPGITEEIRDHLFDPFFSGREAGRGLGFGLSKCWRIVSCHGGTVTADSRPGEGALFSLLIPVVPQEQIALRTDQQHNINLPHNIATKQASGGREPPETNSVG